MRPFIRAQAAVAALSVCLSGPGVQAADNPVPAILRVLQLQTEAWNRGDLEAYMEGYWKSDKLTFYGGGAVVRGWEATLERYRRRYQSEGRSMGRLDFPDQEVEVLGPDTALARGHYHLKMPDGSEPRGLYTVILRKLPEGWRIVHDHSSSESPSGPDAVTSHPVWTEEQLPVVSPCPQNPLPRKVRQSL